MIDFVKFAETKNAALLTFCSVWIGSIITMLRTGQTPLPLGYDRALTIVLPMLTVAALIALTSFLPKRLHHYFKSEDREEKNLLFFGDIAKLGIETYAERVRERYHPPAEAAYSERYLDDLIVQISVQSRIADAKFKAFNTAATIVLTAFVAIAFPPFMWAVRWLLHATASHHI